MMLILPVGMLVGSLEFSIEALSGQADIICSLDPSSQRISFIKRLKAEAEYLSILIEKSEELFIEKIEEFSDSIVSQTAEVSKGIDYVSKQTGDPELQELAKSVGKAQINAVKSISKEEDLTISKVRSSLGPAKLKLIKLHQRIDNIRAH